jgi:transposase-like protein
MGRPSKFAPEVRERAVRLVFEQQDKHESQWAAIASIASKMGCTPETLREWVRQVERDSGSRPGMTTEGDDPAGRTSAGSAIMLARCAPRPREPRSP